MCSRCLSRVGLLGRWMCAAYPCHHLPCPTHFVQRSVVVLIPEPIKQRASERERNRESERERHRSRTHHTERPTRPNVHHAPVAPPSYCIRGVRPVGFSRSHVIMPIDATPMHAAPKNTRCTTASKAQTPLSLLCQTYNPCGDIQVLTAELSSLPAHHVALAL